MLKSNPILLSVAVLLMASLACALPAISTPDPNLIVTAVAQTIIAGLTQTSQSGIPITGLESATATQTFTPELPTLTPSPTLSPTPLFTSTPLIPQITVSVATNCRVGPGKIYDRVGALLVGEVAEVYGRDPTGSYWYIRNPDSTPEFCWLWGQYATFAGNTSVIPVYTPPPTPTPAPAFEASYAGKDTCVGWWVEIKLKNTGGISFRSMSLTIRDTVTDVVLAQNTDSFINLNACTASATTDVLAQGSTRTVSSPPFAYDPAGHNIRATIALCSNTGNSGACITKVITFTP